MTQTQVLEQPEPQQHELPYLIDTHAHLDDLKFDADRDQVVQRARDANVGIVLVSTDLEAAERVIQLAAAHGLGCAAGIHPNSATLADSGLEKRLSGLIAANSVAAIGEIGLDYYRTSPRDVQLDVFQRQLALAVELKLPVIVHNRDATQDVLSALKKFPGLRGVLHSFLGNLDEAEQFLQLDLYLGIGGPITFNKNESLRETVASLPLQRLLIETDSPYLTPAPHRGRRNEPSYARYVAEKLAEIKGSSVAQIALQTTTNAQLLFGV